MAKINSSGAVRIDVARPADGEPLKTQLPPLAPRGSGTEVPATESPRWNRPADDDPHGAKDPYDSWVRRAIDATHEELSQKTQPPSARPGAGVPDAPGYLRERSHTRTVACEQPPAVPDLDAYLTGQANLLTPVCGEAVVADPTKDLHEGYLSQLAMHKSGKPVDASDYANHLKRMGFTPEAVDAALAANGGAAKLNGAMALKPLVDDIIDSFSRGSVPGVDVDRLTSALLDPDAIRLIHHLLLAKHAEELRPDFEARLVEDKRQWPKGMGPISGHRKPLGAVFHPMAEVDVDKRLTVQLRGDLRDAEALLSLWREEGQRDPDVLDSCQAFVDAAREWLKSFEDRQARRLDPHGVALQK